MAFRRRVQAPVAKKSLWRRIAHCLQKRTHLKFSALVAIGGGRSASRRVDQGTRGLLLVAYQSANGCNGLESQVPEQTGGGMERDRLLLIGKVIIK